MLTSYDVDEVVDARLDEDEHLEFEIRSSKSSGTKWIKATRISTRTMTANRFQQFYNQIDESINSPSDLKNFLKTDDVGHDENEQEEDGDGDGDKDEDDGDSDQNNDQDESKHQTQIKLKFGSQTEAFSMESLQSLSYFKAMFANRWSQHSCRDLQQTPIDILGGNNSNSSNNSNQFDFNHLKLLLKCVELNKIPQDLSPNCKLLDGLIACHDFFMNKDDGIINQDSLIDYLTNVKPRLTYQQRQELLAKTTNKIFKQALISYNGELNDEMKEMRLQLVNHHSSVRSMAKIEFDPETAFLLLKQKFKVNIKKKNNHNRTRLHVKIVNYTGNKKDYSNLIKSCQCDAGSWLSRMEPLIKMIVQITNQDNKSLKLQFNGRNQYQVISSILKPTIKAANIDDCKLEQSIFQSRLQKACEVAWRACCDDGRYWFKARKKFAGSMAMLTNNQVQKFADVLVVKSGQCRHIYRVNRYKSKHDRRKMKTAIKQYFGLWKICLIKCSHEWIVENASSWFPIIHKNDNDSVTWILNDIVNDMNGTLAFSFGIYLTKYISYEWNSKQTFPKQYLDFLRDNLGITWNLLN